MHLNLLMREKALIWNESRGMFQVDLALFPGAIERHARELLVVEATGNAARDRELVATLGRMTPPLEATMQRVADVPIDLHPTYRLR